MQTTNPTKNPESLAKVSGANHYTHRPNYTGDNHNMKLPENRKKVSCATSGDNHYTHKPGYDNSNHYAKRPESKLKRAELNKIKFTGYKHNLKQCPHCSKDIPSNNYPQHIRRCLLVHQL